MIKSIQQFYRRRVWLLCVLLFLLLVVVLSVWSWVEARRHVAETLQIQASMLALELSHEIHAEAKTLTPLLERATVNNALTLACLLNEKGEVRWVIHGGAYQGETSHAECDPSQMSTMRLGEVTVYADVTDANLPRPTGRLWLLGKPPAWYEHIGTRLVIAAGVTVLVGLLCWMLGRTFEYLLLKPIRQIATTAQRVTLYKDYSLRVEAGALAIAPREIDALIESFNAMLNEIEDRDTRLTRKSEELEKSRHAAVAASVAKSQFLANVSHELRTPLNAIIGFSTMLRDEQFGALGHEKYREYARDIFESGRHLLDVINDILDLTKAETGTLNVTFESLSLPKIIEKAINIIAGHAHERRIDIYTDLPDKLPRLYADRVRLVQILLNLLSNAIKFTPEGGKVVIRAHAEAAKNNIHYFTIEIEDTGIGMSDADINKAFASFNQADAGLNRKYEGTGLGLPLTKRLIELHHGKIKIRSEIGKGTTVTVRLTSDPALLA